MRPYYTDDLVTIYHADWRAVEELGVPDGGRISIVTDPPYGIDYDSGQVGELARSIANDKDTSERDAMLAVWPDAALVFGTWRRSAPVGTRMALVWDKGPALGMGALDLPWKPSFDLIFVRGTGFRGHRGGAVLQYPPVQSMARNGRTHPHEKPVALMRDLIQKCPPGLIFDPFMGTGATLVAAKSLGYEAVGVELDEGYCEIAAQRCSQEVLGLVG